MKLVNSFSKNTRVLTVIVRRKTRRIPDKTEEIEHLIEDDDINLLEIMALMSEDDESDRESESDLEITIDDGLFCCVCGGFVTVLLEFITIHEFVLFCFHIFNRNYSLSSLVSFWYETFVTSVRVQFRNREKIDLNSVLGGNVS